MRWRTRRCFCFCFCFVCRLLFFFPPPPRHTDLREHEKTQRQRDDQASSECEVTEERRSTHTQKKKYLNDGDVSHLQSDSRRPRGRSQDILIAQVIATPPVARRVAVSFTRQTCVSSRVERLTPHFHVRQIRPLRSTTLT